MNEHHDNMNESTELDNGFEPGFGMEVLVDIDEEPGGLESMRNVSRRRQRWLLGIVVVGGLGAVLALKVLGGGLEEASGDTVMEQLIDHFISDAKQVVEDGESTLGEDSSEHTLLVLQESYQNRQVPIEGLRCNPFLLAVHLTNRNGTAQPAPGSEELQRSRRMEELQSLVADLSIDSTLTGARPMARISGELVMEGAELAGTPEHIVVTLVHVDRGVVTLEATDPVLGLSGRWQRTVGR